MNLATIRQAILDTIADIDPDGAIAVTGYEPAPIIAPHAWISDMTVEPAAFGEPRNITVEVTFAVSPADNNAAVERLDGYLADLDDAFTGTLGGAVDSCTVNAFRNVGAVIQPVRDTQNRYWGFTAEILVLA